MESGPTFDELSSPLSGDHGQMVRRVTEKRPAPIGPTGQYVIPPRQADILNSRIIRARLKGSRSPHSLAH
jgi:hypothetical protein